jgi:malate dehydrogenase (oxaloacetate-decarboxylating)
VLSRIKQLSKKMIIVVLKALVAKAPVLEGLNKPLLLDVEDVRELGLNIAKAVIYMAVKEGLAQAEGVPKDEDELLEWIHVQIWEADYQPLEKADE